MPVPVNIRIATRTDVPAIIRLLAEDPLTGIRENYDAAHTHAAPYYTAFDAITQDKNHLLLVAEQDGAVVGTLQLSFIPGMSFQGAYRAQIEDVMVDSTRRNLGIGSALVDQAIERAKARHCSVVQLTSNKKRDQAHRFYERLGFASTHEGLKLAL